VIQVTTTGTLVTPFIFEYSLNGGHTYTTAVNGAATVALGASGLTAHFPAATYSTASSDRWEVHTICAAISARSSAGFSIEKMSILYNNAAFFGTLMSLESSTLTSPPLDTEASGWCFRDVTFASENGTLTSAESLLMVDGSYDGVAQNCYFNGAASGFRGLRRLQPWGQTNRLTIKDCTFLNCSTSGITNPGSQGITVEGCTFEGTLMPRAVYGDYVSIVGLIPLIGFVFKGNWVGDAATAYRAIPWIDPQWFGFQGGSFTGNAFFQIFSGDFAVGLKSKDSIALGSSGGVEIAGNYIGTIDFSIGVPGSYPQAISVHGNILLGADSTNTATGPDTPWFRGLYVYGTPGAWIQAQTVQVWGNLDDTGTYASGASQNTLEGHLVTKPTHGTAPTVLNPVTFLTAVLDGSPSLAIGSNDSAGRVTITVAGGSTAGGATAQFNIGYVRCFDSAADLVTPPKVFLQPENAASAALVGTTYTSVYKVGQLNAGWAFFSTTGLAPGTYVFSYWVVG
jgi:hypothetical protein